MENLVKFVTFNVSCHPALPVNAGSSDGLAVDVIINLDAAGKSTFIPPHRTNNSASLLVYPSLLKIHCRYHFPLSLQVPTSQDSLTQT